MTVRVKLKRRSGYTRVDELRVDVDGDGVVRLLRVDDPLEELIGSAPGLSAETDLESLRDEWPA